MPPILVFLWSGTSQLKQNLYCTCSRLCANWVGVEDPTNQVTESFDFVVMQQIKKLISALRKHLWPPNLVEC